MSWIGPAIGAVASLFGRRRPTTPGQNVSSAAHGARAAAAETGFNALTLLNSGTAVSGPTPDNSGALAGAQFLSEMATAAVDSWSSRVPGADALAQGIRARELDLLQSGALAEKAVPKNFGYNLHANVAEGPVTVSVSPLAGASVGRHSQNDGRHRFANGDGSTTDLPISGMESGRTWARDPSGRWMHMPSDVAQRLGVKPRGNVMPGEYTELVGEGFGELSAALYNVPIASHMTGNGLGGDPLAKPKEKPKAKTGAPPRPKYGARAQHLWDRQYGSL